MKEVIHWQLIYWKMEMGRDGWFNKPKYFIKLKYATTRNHISEFKYEDEKFDTLKSAFDRITYILSKENNG